MPGVTQCPECKYERFGQDDNGYFCWNCGEPVAEVAKEVELVDCTSPVVEGEPTTLPMHEDRDSMVKKVAAKKTPVKNAPAKKVPTKKTGAPKKGVSKADQQTAEYYAVHGKKDGTPTMEGEKRGELIKGFLNDLLAKNAAYQDAGQYKKMLTNVQIAEKFMKKAPGRNFQPISSYIGYFNRQFGGMGDEYARAGTEDTLKSRSYWDRQAAKEKKAK